MRCSTTIWPRDEELPELRHCTASAYVIPREPHPSRVGRLRHRGRKAVATSRQPRPQPCAMIGGQRGFLVQYLPPITSGSPSRSRSNSSSRPAHWLYLRFRVLNNCGHPFGQVGPWPDAVRLPVRLPHLRGLGSKIAALSHPLSDMLTICPTALVSA